MSAEERISFGLSKGNQNRPMPNRDDDPNHYRGHLKELFRIAGYDLVGFDPEHETIHPYIRGLEDKIQFVAMKPRQIPLMIRRESFDVAIMGLDSFEEFLSGFWDYADRILKDEYYKTEKRDTDFLFRNTPSVLSEKLLTKLIFGEESHDMEDTLENPKLYAERFGEFLSKKELAWKEADRLSRLMLAHSNFRAYALFRNPSIMEEGENIELELADLGIGKTRAVWAIPEHTYLPPSDFKGSISSIDSEYPWLTYRELLRVFPRQMIHFENPPYPLNAVMDIEGFHQIGLFQMVSNTETSDNLTVQCAASGRSLKENGFVEIGSPLLESTARVYRIPNILRYLDRIEEKQIERREAQLREIAYPIIERLKKASLEYGELYRDSIYHKRAPDEETLKKCL